MSGHNRWKKLKRFKAVVAVTKGKLYNKLIKELTIAARSGGGDPQSNPRLRVAIALAREANMPADTITRAVKKGTGELAGGTLEEVAYEGYGPGGVALLVECVTDNINRTAAEVRSAFMHFDSNLGAQGSVRFLFARKGLVAVKPGPSEERVVEVALESGAEDVVALGTDGFEVRTEPGVLHAVASALEQGGLQVSEQRHSYLPATTVRVEGEVAAKLLELITLLEDNDDVQSVYANFEADDALLERLSG